MWITNAFQADWMCLLANTGDGPVHQNKSLICLPMDAKGRICCAVSGKWNTMGTVILV